MKNKTANIFTWLFIGINYGLGGLWIWGIEKQLTIPFCIGLFGIFFIWVGLSLYVSLEG